MSRSCDADVEGVSGGVLRSGQSAASAGSCDADAEDLRRGERRSGESEAGSAAQRSFSRGFEEVWDRAVGVEGWLTDAQARLLHDRARALGSDGTVVEIGSFRGRSSIVLAAAAPAGAEVVAVDPHGGGDRGPGEIAPDAARGDEDNAAFCANLAAAGVARRVRHVRKPSSEALGDVDGDVDLLFVDGAHRFGPARSDIVQWGDRVASGGTMLVHDAFSSVGVTLALLSSTFASRRWRYAGRVGSLAEYQCIDLSLRDRLTAALRQSAQLPWFARNLLIKCMIVARLGRLTRLLGHRGGWPY